jgi:hypothetical protein
MNPEQRILADTYGGGDYSYMTDPLEAEQAYDTLFLFLMRELGPDGDTNRDEYIARLRRAEDDILTIRHALEN